MAKKGSIIIDFTGVTAGSGRCEAGTHFAKLTDIEQKVSSSGNEMLSATFTVSSGECEGCKVYENFLLTKVGLWKLKAFLEAVDIPSEGRIKLDFARMMLKPVIIDVVDDEYNGKKKAKIDRFKKVVIETTEDDDDEEEDEVDEDTDDEEDLDEGGDDEDEEVKPKKAPKKAAKQAPKKHQVDEDEYDDDDWDDEE